ncbi:MAG: type II secretion system F family protein, partial [Planctomycetaceae bacterium]|nr:type II secretion system F family protein [Planctomycetaceae bacterium]
MMTTPSDASFKPAGSRLSTSQLEKFCYRMGASLKAGIPVKQAWANETRMLRGRARRLFDGVQSRLQAGQPLADALSAEPGFPPLLIEMVRVGEETGQLDQAFLKMADHYRALVRMKRTFLQGVTWPVMQLVTAVAVISLFFVILHILETRMTGMRAPDVFLLGLSPLGNLLLFWSVLLIASTGTFLFVTGVRRGWFGAFPMRVLLAVPLVGSTIKSLALSRFAWAFGTAVDSGMNAQKAMRLGLRSTQNRFYLKHEPEIVTSVAEGKDFFTALHQTDAFPNDFLQAVQSGELTGELTESLGRLSDDYREESELNLRRISQISGFGILLTVGT